MLINVNKNFKKVLKKPLKGASVSKIDYFKWMLLRKHGDSEMFAALKKEILIISSKDYPIPFSRTLERAISPTTETVIRAIESF